MKFLFLMDPLSTVKVEKDTSFILMLGAYKKGHQVYFVGDGSITLRNNKLYFDATEVFPQYVKDRPFIKKGNKELSETDIDAIFIRRDPPFNNSYLINTWLLSRLEGRIPIINQPSGIRSVNEKLWATQFDSLIPKTIVSRSKGELTSFLLVNKEIIVKPVNGHGGSSVFYVKIGDKNTNVIFESVSQNWTNDIIAQKYIPQAKIGDKRILLLNGSPLGAVLRVHAEDDHRNNFFAGGKPKEAILTKNDMKIIHTLKPFLQKLGLYFVGIDIIGDYLIEVNVTSPTCMQEINRLYNKSLENHVIKFTENLVQKHRKR